MSDINKEMAKLQTTYNTAVRLRDETKKKLAKEISEQQLTKWELEHQRRRTKDYEKQADKLQIEIAALKSHMPMISESFSFFTDLFELSQNKCVITVTNSTLCFLFSLVTEEGCRHCLPGWTLMNSVCYFFPFSDNIGRKSWNDARQFCTKYGGDLAVIDSRETHVRLKSRLNNNLHFLSGN